jgi:uncharacterized SAM-binding protein YcdF (DUF218 family)
MVMKKTYFEILLLVLIGFAIISLLTASSFAVFASQGFHSTAPQILTPTPTPSTGVSQTGSTDWITLMGIIIVLIVILPVLFRRSTWTK